MKGERVWKTSNHRLLFVSTILGVIGVFLLCGKITDIEKFLHIIDDSSIDPPIFLVFLIGIIFVMAIHSFWGLMVEMADNIATITDIISQNENKVSKPILERSMPTPQSRTQPQTTGKPFIVNIEYDDGMWECGSCGQLNNPDCEFCTNCGKSKGKLKIQPPD